MELRQYQTEIARQAAEILTRLKLVYIAAEVRTGKTLMALEAARLCGFKNVLFLTKKKAIDSIQNDYQSFSYPAHFALTIANDESLHKVTGDFDLVIHDEHHRLGSFPKPSKTTTEFRKKFFNLPMIFLSGTPTPESFSQIYHQFFVSAFSPFAHYTNFYKWAAHFVNKYQVNYGYGPVNSYEKADYNKIKPFIDPYFITYTQKEAGFTTSVSENTLTVKMKPETYALADKLKKDLVIEGEREVILADTAVKLMGKLHQIFSGTIKFESGSAMTLDTTKAEFIRDRFQENKIAIFYKFKQELLLLKEVFKDNLCESLPEFDGTEKNIALQIQSGREGISLAAADYLIYYNMDFSALSYWQSRDRLSTIHRPLNQVYYIFSENGLESHIYKQVIKKKDFTTKHFIKHAGISLPTQGNLAL
jgi:hypothetical protein